MSGYVYNCWWDRHHRWIVELRPLLCIVELMLDVQRFHSNYPHDSRTYIFTHIHKLTRHRKKWWAENRVAYNEKRRNAAKSLRIERKKQRLNQERDEASKKNDVETMFQNRQHAPVAQYHLMSIFGNRVPTPPPPLAPSHQKLMDSQFVPQFFPTLTQPDPYRFQSMSAMLSATPQLQQTVQPGSNPGPFGFRTMLTAQPQVSGLLPPGMSAFDSRLQFAPLSPPGTMQSFLSNTPQIVGGGLLNVLSNDGGGLSQHSSAQVPMPRVGGGNGLGSFATVGQVNNVSFVDNGQSWRSWYFFKLVCVLAGYELYVVGDWLYYARGLLSRKQRWAYWGNPLFAFVLVSVENWRFCRKPSSSILLKQHIRCVLNLSLARVGAYAGVCMRCSYAFIVATDCCISFACFNAVLIDVLAFWAWRSFL